MEQDLQQISYRWQGNWRLKIRYVFINNNKERRPRRSKQGKLNQKGYRKKKIIRGGTSINPGETNSTNNVGFLSLNYDTIATEILSRLPVKSLMRFKCVCKHLRYLIEDDPKFIDLHFMRSKERPGLFMNFPAKASRYPFPKISKGDELVLLTADLFQDGRPVAVNTVWKTNSLHYDRVLGPVSSGLICFIDMSVYAVQIYNVSTREVTPWISSSVFMNEKIMTNSGKYRVRGGVNYQFGFDPVTKEHKVVFVWRILDRNPCQVCEVLTVGDNTWRIIDEVPLIPIDGHGLNVHANGSLYWYVEYDVPVNDNPTEYKSAEFLVAFDIQSEKFRTIKIPAGFDDFESVCDLLEVDAGIAVLRRRRLCNSFKMWIFDDCDKMENGTTTGSISDKLWSVVIITLPFYSDQPFYFHSIPGTDQILIETNTATRMKSYEETAENRIALAWIHSYNWKEHTMAKVDICAISSAIPPKINVVTNLCSTFVETLLPVRKKLRHRGTHPPQEK
ncbi:hypothetical protein MKW92_010369 [Papaver armeniacum]|nr:hypothetical protein MKW92_010369 [Papaver armeniacum]